MLFNSYEFILAFLPIVLGVFALLSRQGKGTTSIIWLVSASLFFYGWWNPSYLLLIAVSILFNYTVGKSLASGTGPRRLLALGVAANLLLLGYFKYAGFFANSVNVVLGTEINLGTIILPLAISFFTFQQIAYLVDRSRGAVVPHGILHYTLFVTFFPQLIAGPIVHQSEMLSQFAVREGKPLRSSDLALGSTLFFAGLFKKVVLADNLALFASPVFMAADSGTDLDLIAAWRGALAYTFQIYFDFSGYSDMAIGLARLFGIRLPLNFHSPYRSANIIEFWRRWHMTLSRFLRDYLYIGLGGNRKGSARRYVNLMLTMVLGGLWHGAGWNFAIWGGLHGCFLVINRAWRALVPHSPGHAPRRLSVALGTGLTFLSVVVAWVFFRAVTLNGAQRMLAAMFGMNGCVIPRSLEPAFGPFAQILDAAGVQFLGLGGLTAVTGAIWITVAAIIAFGLPNTHQWLSRFEPAIGAAAMFEVPGWFERFRWSPSLGWALACAPVACVALLHLSQVSEFLYFQF